MCGGQPAKPDCAAAQRHVALHHGAAAAVSVCIIAPADYRTDCDKLWHGVILFRHRPCRMAEPCSCRECMMV